MTSTPDNDAPASPAHVHDGPAVDIILDILVSFANTSSGEFSMTLNVPGGVVSGNVIGISEWLERVATLLEPHSDDFAGAFRHIKDDHAERTRDDDGPAPKFIHLDGAHWIDSSGTTPEGDGVLWRGRISDIAGWSFGKVGPAE